MEQEQRAWIKKCVFNNLAYVHGGKIMMRDMISLFSDYGNPQELRQALEEFVRDNLAKPIREGADDGYVFPSIAEKIGESILSELKELELTVSSIENGIAAAKRHLDLLEEVSKTWTVDWGTIFGDQEKQAIVVSYVRSHWQRLTDGALTYITQQTEKLQQVNHRIGALKERIENSYRPFGH